MFGKKKPANRPSSQPQTNAFRQDYSAEIQVRTRSGEVSTIYCDGPGPVGMSAAEVRARAEREARAQVPGGQVIGSRVRTDGRWY